MLLHMLYSCSCFRISESAHADSDFFLVGVTKLRGLELDFRVKLDQHQPDGFKAKAETSHSHLSRPQTPETASVTVCPIRSVQYHTGLRRLLYWY